MKDGNATAGQNVASKEGTIQRKHSENQRMSKGSFWVKVFGYKITNKNNTVEEYAIPLAYLNRLL